MVSQEISTVGDKTKAKIGIFNIEVTKAGTKIKVYQRTMMGKKLLYEG